VAVQRFAGSRMEELLHDLAENGQRAAEAVDAAAQALLDAYAQRMEVERRTFQMPSLVHRPSPGDVQRSRADQVTQAAEKLLQGGVETWPEVLHRPGQPRHPTVGAAVPA